jgi:capsular exopolysaccharide synthesis family protein
MAGAGVFVSGRSQPAPATVGTAYSATAILLGAPDRGELGDLDTLAALVDVGAVPERVAARLDRKDPAKIAGFIAGEPDNVTGLLAITATTLDSAEAELLANTFSEELITFVNQTTTRDTRRLLQQVRDREVELTVALDELKQEIVTVPAAERPPLEAAIQRTTLELQIVESSRAQFEEVLESTGPQLIQRANAVEIVAGDPGAAPQGSSPGPAVMIAIILGLGIGLTLVLVLDRSDQRIHTKAVAEEHMGIPVLIELPLLSRRVRRDAGHTVATAPVSLFADACRLLAAHLDVVKRPNEQAATETVRSISLATPVAAAGAGSVTQLRPMTEVVKPSSRGDLVIRTRTPLIESIATRRPCGRPDANGHRGRVILVASAGPDEGKTTVATNLAASFAELGKKTLLLSCDFHRPKVQQVLNIPNSTGVADLALGTAGDLTLDDCIVKAKLDDGLIIGVVPSGTIPDQLGELLNPDRMLTVIDAARDIAEIVIIDTAPILAASDLSALAPHVDSTIFVARAGKTKQADVDQATDILEQLGTPLCGGVLNAVKEMTMWSRPQRRRFSFRRNAA